MYLYLIYLIIEILVLNINYLKKPVRYAFLIYIYQKFTNILRIK